MLKFSPSVFLWNLLYIPNVSFWICLGHKIIFNKILKSWNFFFNVSVSEQGQYDIIELSCCTLVFLQLLEKMAKIYCSVSECLSNSSISEISFNKIPVNYSKDWLAACGRNADWRPKPSSKICTLQPAFRSPPNCSRQINEGCSAFSWKEKRLYIFFIRSVIIRLLLIFIPEIFVLSVKLFVW